MPSISKLVLQFSVLLLTLGSVAQSHKNESQQLEELYQQAIKEGGQLVARFGGDEKNQQDGYVALFQARFPKINITWTVDLSKYHDGIIDRNLNLTGKAGVDVVFLQTLHDFDRWKAEGHLLQYRPIGYDQVHSHAKDGNDGFWTGVFYFAFSSTSNPAAFNDSGPISFTDYLTRPDLTNKIVLTYPNDDDAVAFAFNKLINTYGWEQVLKFTTRPDIRWVRGTGTPVTLLSQNGTLATTFSAGGGPGLTTTISDDSITTVWPQTGAIFKTAEHPAAAKLLVSWALTEESQSFIPRWPIRNDLPIPAGFKPLDQYPNIDPTEFRTFMRDRALVERIKLQFEQILGTAQGLSPLDDGI